MVRKIDKNVTFYRKSPMSCLCLALKANYQPNGPLGILTTQEDLAAGGKGWYAN